jgi:hypothetical protein
MYHLYMNLLEQMFIFLCCLFDSDVRLFAEQYASRPTTDVLLLLLLQFLFLLLTGFFSQYKDRLRARWLGFDFLQKHDFVSLPT